MPSSPEGSVLRGLSSQQATRYEPAPVHTVAAAEAVDHGRRPTGPVLLDEVYAEEVARLRSEASDLGYRDGYAAGMQAAQVAIDAAVAEARAEVAAQHADWERQARSLGAALSSAAEQMQRLEGPVIDEAAAVISGAAFSLLENLFARELAVAVSPGADAVQRALSVCPAGVPVTVRLHPADHAALPAEVTGGFGDTVTLVPDPTVTAGGAVAEAGPARVDAQFTTALARVRDLLTPDGSGEQGEQA